MKKCEEKADVDDDAQEEIREPEEAPLGMLDIAEKSIGAFAVRALPSFIGDVGSLKPCPRPQPRKNRYFSGIARMASITFYLKD